MVIYARAWHARSRLCIRKGPLELLIPAETHNVISSAFVQKNPKLGLSFLLAHACAEWGIHRTKHQGQETSGALRFLAAGTGIPAPACAYAGVPWLLLDLGAKCTFPNLSQI